MNRGLRAMAGSPHRQVGAGCRQLEVLPDHLRLGAVAGATAAQAFVEALEVPD
jgi:hypothetical protein